MKHVDPIALGARLRHLLSGAVLAGAALGAGAQPSAMPDLMFQSQANASAQLGWRGYTLSNQESAGGNRFWQYWWNGQRGECLRVAINHDQVTQIIATRPSDCPNRAGGLPPPSGGGGSWGGGGGSPQADLVYRPEAQAARELQRRGYLLSNTVAAGAGYWQYWWSGERGQCLRVAVNGGQVSQIIATNPAECPQRGGGPQPPFGGGGGGGGGSPQADLVYRPEAQAARELQRRGYQLSNTVPAGAGFWQYWWSGQSGQCLRVAVNAGQVSQIITTRPDECPRRGGGGGGLPPTGGAVPNDMLNQSVGTVERVMPQRGYQLSNTVPAGAGFWQFWWQDASQQCVRLAVNGGRVTQVTPRGRGDCRR